MKFEKCGQRALAAAVLLAAVFGSAASAGAATFDSNNNNNGNSYSYGNGNSGDDDYKYNAGGDGSGSLVPVLECLATNRDASGTVTGYTAVFGYTGAPRDGATVPVGSANKVSGGSWTGTQITSFPYGNNGRGVGVMRLTFTSGQIKWTLNGSSAHAVVSQSPDCSPAAQVPEGPAGVLALSGLAAAGVGAFCMKRRNDSHALTA